MKYTDLCDSYAHDKTLGIDLVRSTLLKYGGKTCLDIGCGLMERPAYMVEEIDWVGIDPDEADHDFPFILAYAEDLPFDDNSFDSALFATSIDHLDDPTIAVEEAMRVVKPGGHIIVWVTLRPKKKRYKDNLVRRKGAKIAILMTDKELTRQINSRHIKKSEIIYDKRNIPPGWYNEKHRWGFSEESLMRLFKDCGFVEKINIKWGVNIFVWTCIT